MQGKSFVKVREGEVVQRTIYTVHMGHATFQYARWKNKRWLLEKANSTDYEYRAVRQLTFQEICYINPHIKIGWR